MQTIHFNTGRQYSAQGQRIAAIKMPNGDIVFIDIDPNKSDIKSGDSIGTIEAVKTVSDIYAPCSGKLVEVNSHLQAQPEVVNSDPYGLGWMVKIEISDPSELNSLLDSNAYKQLIGK